jgi:hypothetical protein
MERLILTQAWNQESLKEKDGPLNSFPFLWAPYHNQRMRRTPGRLTAISINQCPKERLNRRTTRLPRYLAISMAGISFRLA